MKIFNTLFLFWDNLSVGHIYVISEISFGIDSSIIPESIGEEINTEEVIKGDFMMW